MTYNELENKLKEINIENNIWIIYIGIIILSWYSNSLEKDYFINNNQYSKEKYRKIIILIFFKNSKFTFFVKFKKLNLYKKYYYFNIHEICLMFLKPSNYKDFFIKETKKCILHF